LISVGYFSDTFSDFGGLSSRSWADITATDFSEISSGLINPAGEWAGGSDEDGILGEKLYVWVFDSLSLPTFVNDVEFGLYTGSSADWTGKADNTGVPPITNVLSINSVDSVIYGTDLGDNLALVPEPVQVTAIAGLIGLVVVLRKRKRRNS